MRPSNIIIALAVAEVAVAVRPLGGAMGLVRRQAVCVGPVICEQDATRCTSCETGFYCSGGGCCEEGQVCAGFKPCVNAGTPVDDAEQTQVCPTDAPLCTASDLIPICSGGIADWATISEALGGGAQTTDVDTPIFTTPSFTAPATSTPEVEFTSTSDFEVESTSMEESTTPAPTTAASTTAAPDTTDAAETTSSRGSRSTTANPSPTPNSSAKMQLGLGFVASFALAVSILL